MQGKQGEKNPIRGSSTYARVKLMFEGNEAAAEVLEGGRAPGVTTIIIL